LKAKGEEIQELIGKAKQGADSGMMQMLKQFEETN